MEILKSSESEWKAHIDSLSKGTVISDRAEAIRLLKEKLTLAVEKLTAEKFGILFSGGVDSTVIAAICKSLGKEFNCYTVGIRGSKDIEAAEEIAKQLGLNLVKKELTLNEIDSFLKKAVKILPLKDVVNSEVATVEFAAIDLAKKNGDTSLFSGLGSEEIFAGYHRHKEASNVNEECWRGLKAIWKRDLQREAAISAAENVKLLTPFLDDELITAAMQIPGEWKISSTEKKIILREAAVELGVPKEFAFRKKLAAQYGSSISKAVEKISKEKGFKLRNDYLDSLQT
ncbi:asparagine synthase C-terminal domain-containing protein [Candidatus Woesearchaeota archaeon]|nr:asparagine synthase C-terminal domain-containing protein [Candidatus Woesearchaeota archaeon]